MATGAFETPPNLSLTSRRSHVGMGRYTKTDWLIAIAGAAIVALLLAVAPNERTSPTLLGEFSPRPAPPQSLARSDRGDVLRP